MFVSLFLIAIAEADPPAWLIFLERFGLPVALLAVILYGMFKAARWIAPRIDKLIGRHEELLDTLEGELTRNSDVLAQLGANQAQLGETQDKILECLRELKKQTAA